MKIQSINFWQLDDGEVLKLPKLTQLLVYDTWGGDLKLCHPRTSRSLAFLRFNNENFVQRYVFLMHKEPI